MSMVETTEKRAAVPAITPARLPYHPALQERFGVGQAEWRALVDAVFPLAKEASSVILALSYCKARNLDPFKKPVHIVPMWNGQLKRMVETVWPGIGELRTTAFRTGQYAGRDEARYGEIIKRRIGNAEIEFPEWCQVTVYRLLGGQRLPFPGPRVYWLECYATAGKDDNSPNSMWRRRPFGQLDKCAEAAALRAAFPEEVGNEYAAEEMEGRTIDGAAIPQADGIVAPRTLAGRLDAIAGAAPVEHDPETGEVTDEPQETGAGASTAPEAAAGEGERPHADSAAADLFEDRSLAWRLGWEAAENETPRDRPPSEFDPDEAEEWQAGHDAWWEAKAGVKTKKRERA
ncbi:phage recombination protein Bet [Methylocystis sp. JR02]|uniref:phage recombination protein Bet n=1 Tax=Methylocystis sp. JR02 TaxID=3046284 RepID=UPI0024BB3908|nr:phage recombination protein Bet [Methylocystis sp. JR02]MDJ0449213.1 phage recombination protein Bet [Methylocystis sp. JR02]